MYLPPWTLPPPPCVGPHQQSSPQGSQDNAGSVREGVSRGSGGGMREGVGRGAAGSGGGFTDLRSALLEDAAQSLTAWAQVSVFVSGNL